ncbi:hypothetical protein [Jeotgalibacillus aurantiacus]|uniref:hypothetical protein n=1 Tax=Jeotgalibacillus aurantiacus TaxID=2763266 RepID=UPI001D0A4DC0|nr:hypothetical protein [Jeotgalibacillus aurantiacus]
MRKPVIIAFVLFFGLAGIILASNTFEKTNTAVIQYWEADQQSYGEELSLENQEDIEELTAILNNADHRSRQSEMATFADVKVTFTYENGDQESVYLWEESGRFTRFTSSERNGTYTINGSKAKDTLSEILR